MSDRFNDDNFIEAAKAYQNIKAPSGLRERVLEGIETGSSAPAESAAVSARRSMPKGSTGARSKVYRFGALAACLAIMVVSMPGLLKEADMTELLHGSELAAGISQEPDVQEAGGEEQEGSKSRQADVPEIPDGTGEPTAEPDLELADETSPVNQPAAADAAETAKSQKPAYDPEPAAYSLEPADLDLEGEEEVPEQEFPDTYTAQTGGQKDYTAALALSKLLPTMVGDEETVEGWEIRLVEAGDGACIVEIASGEETAAIMTMFKNEESGQWEVNS